MPRKRSASPKRTFKPTPNKLLSVLRLYLEFTEDFEDFILLYRSAKALWPAFGNIAIRVKCDIIRDWKISSLDSNIKHRITISKLQDWQTLYYCYQHRVPTRSSCLWGVLFTTLVAHEYWELAARFAKELGFAYDVYCRGLVLNGKLRVYKTFTKTLSIAEKSFLLYLCSREMLITAPLFGRSLFNYIRSQIEDFREFDYCFFRSFLRQTATFRLLQGVEIINSYKAAWLSKLDNQPSIVEIDSVEYYGVYLNWKKLEKNIARLREWGHPKALQLVDRVLLPYLEKIKPK